MSEPTVVLTDSNDVSTQLNGSDATRLINQDQAFLASVYESSLMCHCTTPPVSMHIKRRTGEKKTRYWLSDNPRSSEHDIECPLFTHHVAPLDDTDPYRINTSVHFNVVERNQNKNINKENPKKPLKAGVNTQKIALKPLIERVFRHLYENSFSGYYFGDVYPVSQLVWRIKRSDMAKELTVNNVPTETILFNDMKGLAIMKTKLRDGEITTGIWCMSFSHYVNKDGGIVLDGRFFPATVDIKKPETRGPFLLVSAWSGQANPICRSAVVYPIASRELALPVISIEHRKNLLKAADDVKTRRTQHNKLYLFQPFPLPPFDTVVGEIMLGQREKRVTFTAKKSTIRSVAR